MNLILNNVILLLYTYIYRSIDLSFYESIDWLIDRYNSRFLSSMKYIWVVMDRWEEWCRIKTKELTCKKQGTPGYCNGERTLALFTFIMHHFFRLLTENSILNEPIEIQNMKRHSEGTFSNDYSKYLETRRAQDFVQWLKNSKRNGWVSQFFGVFCFSKDTNL